MNTFDTTATRLDERGPSNGLNFALQEARKRASKAATASLLLAMAAGCMSHPLDGQQIDDSKAVLVEGLVPWKNDLVTGNPGVRVGISTSKNGRTWPMHKVTTARTSATLDPDGQKWYLFSDKVNLSFPDLWRGSLSSHTNTIELRTFVLGKGRVDPVNYDPKYDQPVATFKQDSATADCALKHQDTSYLAVIGNCSTDKATVTLSTECGRTGKMCCGDAFACDGSLRCRAEDGTCGSCGARGQKECRDASGGYYCNSGLRISHELVCDYCGANGQPVCVAGYCNAGLSWGVESLGNDRYRFTRTCVPCGGHGQVACSAGNPGYCSSGHLMGNDYICRRAPTTPPPSSPPPPPPPPPPMSPNPPGPCNWITEPCCSGDAVSDNKWCAPNLGLECRGGYCQPKN